MCTYKQTKQEVYTIVYDRWYMSSALFDLDLPLKLFNYDVRIWFQTKPLPIDLCDQTQNSGRCQKLWFYVIRCIDSMFQPALGPTANSYPQTRDPAPNVSTVTRKFWTKIVWNLLLNETVLQQNIIPNSFHSILKGMEGTLGLRFDTDYATKKIQGSQENRHHCNEVTCASKLLFLRIAQFQQLVFDQTVLPIPTIHIT